MEVLLFGMLADVTGKSKVEVDGATVDLLKENLFKKFPALKKHTFLIAVNQEMVDGNALLSKSDEVALLPPYAGG